ncbi:MAG TPA: DUF3617 family protein [Sphingomicrobium sp.]|nr:DUF3617 family protein [Sphingomicrobium sp.]
MPARKGGEEEMGMSKLLCMSGLALALAACGGEKKEEAVAEAAPAKLSAGLYEVSAQVTELASTDNTTPATKLKQGETQVTKACVSDTGEPAPELLAEAGDKCEIKNSYIRNGRMSAQMSCTREGHLGYVMPAMMGSYSAEGFEGEINTLTYFNADGDYRLTRKITAKRVGECPAEGAEQAPS